MPTSSSPAPMPPIDSDLFERIWLRLRAKGIVASEDDRERMRLASVVLSLPASEDEDDFIGRAVRAFMATMLDPASDGTDSKDP